MVGIPPLRVVPRATIDRVAMLSAAQRPVVLYGPIHLPGIAPQNISVFAVLRLCHTIFAYLLFLTFTAHMCAVLFHTFVLRDRMIDRMALWPAKAQRPHHDRDSTTATVAPDRDSPAPSASPSP